MANRSRDWNEGLARDLRDPEFAREFVLGLIEEGFSLQVALEKFVLVQSVSDVRDGQAL